MAACATVGYYGNQYYSYIDWAVNWGVSYNLPNETYSQTLRRKAEDDLPRSITSRRFRRDVYQKMEILMNRYESQLNGVLLYSDTLQL